VCVWDRTNIRPIFALTVYQRISRKNYRPNPPTRVNLTSTPFESVSAIAVASRVTQKISGRLFSNGGVSIPPPVFSANRTDRISFSSNSVRRLDWHPCTSRVVVHGDRAPASTNKNARHRGSRGTVLKPSGIRVTRRSGYVVFHMFLRPRITKIGRRHFSWPRIYVQNRSWSIGGVGIRQSVGVFEHSSP